MVSNNAGVDDFGLGILLKAKQVRGIWIRLMCYYVVGSADPADDIFLRGREQRVREVPDLNYPNPNLTYPNPSNFPPSYPNNPK